jgi:hypothetical protein
MTLEQARNLRHGQEVHYTGRHMCRRAVGPRGGVTVNVTRVRVSGNVQTWKRDPGRVRVPVKYGLRESASITEYDLVDWHVPADCPVPELRHG